MAGNICIHCKKKVSYDEMKRYYPYCIGCKQKMSAKPEKTKTKKDKNDK